MVKEYVRIKDGTMGYIERRDPEQGVLVKSLNDPDVLAWVTWCSEEDIEPLEPGVFPFSLEQLKDAFGYWTDGGVFIPPKGSNHDNST